MSLTLANRITLLRLFCIPFFILLLLYYEKSVLFGQRNETLRIAASIVFIGTFLSDALDGYIARSRNQISRLGTILDPMADKALLLSGLVMLSYSSVQSFTTHLPVWFVWLVISRDVMLVIGSILIHVLFGSVTVKPKLPGKITTFFQMLIIIWVIIDLPVAPFVWILWTGAFFTVISGIQYFFDGIKQFDRP
jgi:CDP-diacylglycerol--glycerol-3-phosphate 3-phosphatidyltransferase